LLNADKRCEYRPISIFSEIFTETRPKERYKSKWQYEVTRQRNKNVIKKEDRKQRSNKGRKKTKTRVSQKALNSDNERM
jgi:hypothetical protein